VKLGKPIRLSKLYRNSKPPLEDAPLWQVVDPNRSNASICYGVPPVLSLGLLNLPRLPGFVDS